jgi:hypothetical protein
VVKVDRMTPAPMLPRTPIIGGLDPSREDDSDLVMLTG